MTHLNVTPVVRATAARLSVDLAQVAGTGVGGRIRPSDVEAASKTQPQAKLARAERAVAAAPLSVTAASPGGATRQVQSSIDPWKTVTVDVYARNPLLDDARQSSLAYPLAQATATPAPTVFESGDLPPWTASGVESAQLLRVPWYARHWAAAEPDRGAVLAAVEHFASTPISGWDKYSHPGAQMYMTRVKAWLDAGSAASVAGQGRY